MSISQLDSNSIVDVLDLPDGTTVIVNGPSVAGGFSNSSLAGFPGSIFNRFLVISTGIASDVNGANTAGNQGTDLGTTGASGDSLTLNFTIPKTSNAASVAFDFTFLSEEFPEFVGSQFNDFLSVRLDGTEIALDTSGNPITVNNNFFDPSLTPSGTIFDGQTTPIRITAPLSGTSNTFNLEIQIADVGDGIYDSAAFINNFELLEPQIFFVDFDGGSIDFGTQFFFFDDSVTLPASSISTAEQNQIITNANNVYSDFLVEFTTTMPTEGDFSTILVGGNGSNVPNYADPNNLNNLLGRADGIDFGNEDKSDNAFVLSDQPAFSNSGGNNVPLLSQVVAHEAGHILGLRHVLGSNELMYPFAGAGSTNIGGSMQLAEITGGIVTPIGGNQDSRGELTRNVGLRNSSELIVVESIFENILKFFGFSLNSSASTIFDAKIATVNTEGEIIDFVELGDIPGDEAIEFITPATDGDLIVFAGKSSPSGELDTFLSPGGVTTFDPSTATDFSFIETFAIPVSEVQNGIELVVADDEGNLTLAGTPNVTVLDLESSEATNGDDVLIGTEENDSIVGLGGNDSISGNGGDDQIFGNDDNDTLIGGAGADTLDGDDGDDLIEPGVGFDEITLGNGNDTVQGVSSELDLNLITDFQEGDRIVIIGEEFSTVQVDSTTETTLLSFEDGLTISLSGDFNNVNFVVDPQVVGDQNNTIIEIAEDTQLVAADDSFSTDINTAFTADVLTNDSDPDGDALVITQVNGNALEIDNTLTLDSGALLTLRADNTFNYDPNGQYDSLTEGESAFDSFSYTIQDSEGNTASASVNISINGIAQDTSEITGTDNDDFLDGTSTDDTIRGLEGNDFVRGFKGNDSIYGDGGNDHLNGNASDDFIDGGDGRDRVYGGLGNDTLNDGAGNGRLFGGAGDDVFFSSSGDDVFRGDAGRDTYIYDLNSDAGFIDRDSIDDFEPGEDKIAFRLVVDDPQSLDSFDDLDTNGSGSLDSDDERVEIIDNSTVIDFSDLFGRTDGSDTIVVEGVIELNDANFLFGETAIDT